MNLCPIIYSYIYIEREYGTRSIVTKRRWLLYPMSMEKAMNTGDWWRRRYSIRIFKNGLWFNTIKKYDSHNNKNHYNHLRRTEWRPFERRGCECSIYCKGVFFLSIHTTPTLYLPSAKKKPWNCGISCTCNNIRPIHHVQLMYQHPMTTMTYTQAKNESFTWHKFMKRATLQKWSFVRLPP